MDIGDAVAIHYLVFPQSPKKSGVLLNEEGFPVLTDYEKVNWKSLADEAQSQIDGSVPKGIKIYISNDAVDVMDVLHISTETGREFVNKPYAMQLVQACMKNVNFSDMRGGILNIASKPISFHLNTPSNGLRPPLGAFIVTIKLSRASQIIDYLSGITLKLFGSATYFAPYPGGKSQFTTNGIAPEYLRKWLRQEFGVVYGNDCLMSFIGRTEKD